MHPPVTQGIANFIHDLPKTETHLHIEGALPNELLKKIDPERFSKPQPSWGSDFKWESFKVFEDHLIEHAMLWFTSADRYYEAAEWVFEDLLKRNVRYVETSFHSGIIEFINTPGAEILNAIRSAVPDGLEVRVFMGITRNAYTDTMGPVLEDCVNWDGLAGLDLHGVESLPLEDWTPQLWAKARDAGMVTKAHAGEFGPASNIREAIEVLGSNRIQHGVHAIDDESVMDLILSRDVTLDMCPISNVKLNAVDKMEDHPIRKLFDRGIRCTISTDDPFSFGNCIEDEYAALYSKLNFSKDELAKIASNGFEVALVDKKIRKKWINDVALVLSRK